MPNQLFILRGLPGSGKSTLGDFLARSLAGRHLEADMFFMISGQYRFDPSKLHQAHKWCQDECALAMDKKYPAVIVSNTFTRNREIRPYIDLAKQFDYRYTVLTVESGRDNFSALASRNIHGVPVEAIENMANRWEQFKD